MAETVHQEPTTPAAEGQQPERTFTQAEMNAIISDRLSRERSKYADYDDLKAKAQQFDAAMPHRKRARPSCRRQTRRPQSCRSSWTA